MKIIILILITIIIIKIMGALKKYLSVKFNLKKKIIILIIVFLRHLVKM